MRESLQVPTAWVNKSKDFGTQRESQNGGNDTPAYAHKGRLPYSSLTASRLAVLGEVAAHFYFGVDPESTVFVVDRTAANYKALKANADLTVSGRKIEVRNSTRVTAPIPIKKKDVQANAIVVQVHVVMEGGVPTGEVLFLGWADAAKDYPKGYKNVNGTSYKNMRNPMESLQEVLGL